MSKNWNKKMNKAFIFFYFSMALTALFLPLQNSDAAQRSSLQSIPAQPFHGVWLIRDPDAQRITAHLVVHAGEADNPGTEGLAHYVEHLAWLNTGAQDQSNYDSHSNAWTSAIATGYWLNSSAENLEEILHKLMLVLSPLVVDEQIMLEERNIILREHDYRLGNNPLSRYAEAFFARLHTHDPRGRSIIGKPEVIRTFSLDEARQLHANSHCIDNATLLIVGNLTARQLRRALKSATGDIQSCHVKPSPLHYQMTEKGLNESVTLTDKQTVQHRLFFGTTVQLPTPIDPHALEAQLQLLKAVLNSTLPGSLARPLRFDAHIANSYELQMSALDRQHLMLNFFATPDMGISLEKLLERFEAELSAIAAAGIPEKTFERIQMRMLRDLGRVSDPLTSSLQHSLRLIAARTEPQTHEQYIAQIETVTLEQVNQLIMALAGDGHRVTKFITPQE